ncbi:MAG: radical SAM family heme chaperone HemW [Candidatus Delongbacteria bacterium]|nr:radical SAM family heme chaperone HemW [Candidatus Delongbacteria bacterium]
MCTKPLSIYIHLPFCRSKCPYCAFYSIPNPADDRIESYIDGLIREWQLYKNQGLIANRHLTTLYLGGGTPSYSSLRQTEKIIRTITADIITAPDIEITIEANPDSLTPDKASNYPSLGITRLSLGVQSSLDKHLATLGRPHRIDQTLAVLDHLNTLPYHSFNLDFIFAVPHQSLQDLESDLDLIRRYHPPHLSWYGLSYEEDTDFFRRYSHRESDEDDEIRFHDMYLKIDDQLGEMGYEHYEISNFCRPDHAGRHNRVYWNQGDYLGLGASASSYLDGKRFTNPSDIDGYLQQIHTDRLTYHETFPLSESEQRLEHLFLSLRQAGGLDISLTADLYRTPKSELLDYIRRAIPETYRYLLSDRLRLTPEGWLISNSIVLELEEFLECR